MGWLFINCITCLYYQLFVNNKQLALSTFSVTILINYNPLLSPKE